MKTQLELIFCSEFGFFPPQSLLDVIHELRVTPEHDDRSDDEILRTFHLIKMRRSLTYNAWAMSKILFQEKVSITGK